MQQNTTTNTNKTAGSKFQLRSLDKALGISLATIYTNWRLLSGESKNIIMTPQRQLIAEVKELVHRKEKELDQEIAEIVNRFNNSK